MKRCALIGHPVAGSLSPALMAAAYAGRYAYDLVDRDTFPAAWQAFLDGYDGIKYRVPRSGRWCPMLPTLSTR